MTIGRLPAGEILAQARLLAACGGPIVPHGAKRIEDLTVSTAADLNRISRHVAGHTAALVLSSGGTTGKPKVTFVPHHQAVELLRPHWWPLTPDNVLLNLFNPGRMWASHYYMQRLAERSCCRTIPFGPLAGAEARSWVGPLAELGVDALAGTPTSLADFAEAVLTARVTLPVATVIWMAEEWSPRKRSLVRAAFPDARFWGNYGSVETYVIATSRPRCDEGVLHLLPRQLVEPHSDGALLTRVGAGWTVPVVRYRLGDRIAVAECRCAAPDGLRVLGRADDTVKFRGATFSIGAVLATVREVAGVEEAQLELASQDGGRQSTERLRIRFVGDASAERILARVLSTFGRFQAILAARPGDVTAIRVVNLVRIDRTNKVPPAVWLRTPPDHQPDGTTG